MTHEKKTDAAEVMSRTLRGASLNALEQPAEGVWQFDFVQAGLTVECPWRIVASNAVVLSGSDHGQKFGLPAPIDAISEALRILGGRILEKVEIDATTADLRLTFSGDTRIDAFNNSSGYECWNYGDRAGVTVVGMGGGQITTFQSPPGQRVNTPQKGGKL